MTAAPPSEVDRTPHLRTLVVVVGLLFVVVAVSIVARLTIDWPNIRAGTTPDDDFAERYVAHPWLGYLHIVPGVIYLLGAPLQLSRRFRTRHYSVHRRLGRALLACGLIAGVYALLFGVLHPWGGWSESTATVVFGTWFLACLSLAYRSIRSGDARQHRRWMIRAFAVGIGIGTIRIWIGVFTGIQQSRAGDTEVVSPDSATFGLAFWLAFVMHAAIAEWWLRRTPALDG